MEGFELFSEVRKVKAPEDFEARVLARLSDAARARSQHRAHVRLAFAGVAAAAVIGGVMLGVFVLPGHSPVSTAGVMPRPLRSGTYVPMLEKVDYSSEYRSVSHQPKTVFILEQVSEGSPSGVRF